MPKKRKYDRNPVTSGPGAPTLWDVRSCLKHSKPSMDDEAYRTMERGTEALQTLFDLGMVNDGTVRTTAKHLIKRIRYFAKRKTRTPA